jgi:hypothetical protein
MSELLESVEGGLGGFSVGLSFNVCFVWGSGNKLFQTGKVLAVNLYTLKFY